MSQQELIEQACKNIGKYFGANTKNAFVDRILEMYSGTAPTDSKPIRESVIEAVINLTDGGLYAEEIIGQDILSGVDGDDKNSLINSFLVVCKDDATMDHAELKHPVVKMSDMLGDLGGTVNTSSPPTRDKPGLGIIQVFPVELNFGNKDTGAVEIFLNAIPAIEWSRSVPYVSVEVISPGLAVQNGKIAKLGLMKFLMGNASVSEGTPTYTIANAVSTEVAAMNAEAAADAAQQNAEMTAAEMAEEGPAVAQTFSSAGMEIFTSPQTLIPANEIHTSYDAYGGIDGYVNKNAEGVETPLPGEPGHHRAAPILDRMRPFLTLTELSISVKPTRGMMSHKSAKLSMTLHDRSRLAEIAEFVKPSSFGQTEIMIEYGWSHPDGTVGGKNEFGKLINALRVKEKFGVYNSSYSFTEDGQVEISLDMVTKGAANMNISDIGLSGDVQAKWYAIEKLIEKIRYVRRDVLADEGMSDVVGMSVISSLSPSNLSDSFSGDKLQELQRFISNSLNSTNEDLAELAGYMDNLSDDLEDFNTTIGSVISSKISRVKGTGDPFLTTRYDSDAIAYQAATGTQISDNSNWCSLGKIMAIFIGLPVAESGRFEEVQMIYYAFNDSCSYASRLNIATFPVELNGDSGFEKLFKAFQEEKVQISPNKFLNFMQREFLSNQAAKAYGFSKLYTRDEDGKVVLDEKYKDDPDALKSHKDAVLEDAYGVGADMKFKLPRIQMYAEAVPHQKASGTPAAGQPWAPSAGNTILRLHFFDSATTKYSGLGELLRITRNSEMAATAATFREFTSLEDGDQSQHAPAFQAAMDQAEKSQLLKKVTAGDGTEYLRVVGGVPRLKYFVKSTMPSIIYGSTNSAVQKLSVQSMHNSKDTTIHMQRAQRNASSDTSTPGEQDRGLPLRMMPMQVSMTTFGCPLLAHGQQMFVDLGTGTTVDNIYAVNGLDHKITPGEFVTDFKMVPFQDAYGTYESLSNMVTKASAIINDGGESGSS